MPRVIAAPGLRVPHEKTPRKYITGEPTDVPDTTYYRRRLASGELVLAPADVSPAEASAEAAAAVKKPDAAAAATSHAKNRSKS